MDSQRFVDWSFGHYLGICPPEFADATTPGGRERDPLDASASAVA
jgi:hypothetical protein